MTVLPTVSLDVLAEDPPTRAITSPADVIIPPETTTGLSPAVIAVLVGVAVLALIALFLFARRRNSAK